MKKQNYNFPIGHAIAIVISFLLAILDMIFLYRAVQSVFGQSRVMAMIISLGIASIANYSAFQWGALIGSRARKRFSFNSFLWIFIGFLYAAIRGINIYMHPDKLDIRSEIFQMVVLAIFYIGTGLTIRSSAAHIFDADAVRYRKARKEFEEVHRYLAKTEKSLTEDFAILKNYGNHYEALLNQKNEIERGIEKTEKATAAAITGLVLKNNPTINATQAHIVMEESLDDAKRKLKAKAQA